MRLERLRLTLLADLMQELFPLLFLALPSLLFEGLALLLTLEVLM